MTSVLPNTFTAVQSDNYQHIGYRLNARAERRNYALVAMKVRLAGDILHPPREEATSARLSVAVKSASCSCQPPLTGAARCGGVNRGGSACLPADDCLAPLLQRGKRPDANPQRLRRAASDCRFV